MVGQSTQVRLAPSTWILDLQHQDTLSQVACLQRYVSMCSLLFIFTVDDEQLVKGPTASTLLWFWLKFSLHQVVLLRTLLYSIFFLSRAVPLVKARLASHKSLWVHQWSVGIYNCLWTALLSGVARLPALGCVTKGCGVKYQAFLAACEDVIIEDWWIKLRCLLDFWIEAEAVWPAGWWLAKLKRPETILFQIIPIYYQIFIFMLIGTREITEVWAHLRALYPQSLLPTDTEFAMSARRLNSCLRKL